VQNIFTSLFFIRKPTLYVSPHNAAIRSGFVQMKSNTESSKKQLKSWKKTLLTAAKQTFNQ